MTSSRPVLFLVSALAYYVTFSTQKIIYYYTSKRNDETMHWLEQCRNGTRRYRMPATGYWN